MKRMKKIGTLLILSGLFASCGNNQQQEKCTTTETADAKDYALIGKKGISTFPDMKAEISYASDSTMHWKTTNSKGEINEGDEKFSYEKLTDNLHFLNWVEENGYVISVVINTKDKKVNAFVTYADEKARGKRGSIAREGKFEFVK